MTNYEPETGGAACPIFRKKGHRAVVLCNGPQPPMPLLEYWLSGADLFRLHRRGRSSLRPPAADCRTW